METQAKLQRAKDRLYVLCQSGGWGLLLFVQLLMLRLRIFTPENAAQADPSLIFAIVRIVTMGWLITHYSRRFFTRLGWKNLGWRALLPRIVLAALAMGFVWCIGGFVVDLGILRYPWHHQYSVVAGFLAVWMQATFTTFAWLGLYFCYHAFDRLNRMQVEQLRMAANVKEAELRALKSQVNPHFLFNSLNSLRALIDEDAPRAREAVTRLANMLRYSLQSGQLETVPFDDELRIVEDYVALEQIRHENRLQVCWDVTEDVRARSLPVPPMLLQTLVENAIKYGISTRREGGEIGIAARLDGASLQIRVTNPGELDAPLSATVARAGSSTGVGLRNASERLKLLFGDRASLALTSDPRGRVTASVTIPLNHSA